MPNEKNRLIEEQKKRQEELIALKKMRQNIAENDEQQTIMGDNPAKIEMTFVEKIKHWFYYYKKVALVFLLCVSIVAVGVVQCSGRTSYDYSIVFYSTQTVDSTMMENLSRIFAQYVPDLNNDGEVNVLMVDCCIPESERLLTTGTAKSTRLMAQFGDPKVILYLVDDEMLLNLSEQSDGQFIDNSLSLPYYDGKALKLNGTKFDAAFDTVDGYANHSKTFNYYLVRRIVDGTAIEGDSDAEKYSAITDQIINEISADLF